MLQYISQPRQNIIKQCYNYGLLATLRLARFGSIWVGLSEFEIVANPTSSDEAEAAKQKLHQLHETHASHHASPTGQGKRRVSSDIQFSFLNFTFS